MRANMPKIRDFFCCRHKILDQSFHDFLNGMIRHRIHGGEILRQRGDSNYHCVQNQVFMENPKGRTRALKNQGVGRAAEKTFLEKGWSQIQIGTAIAACATQH